MLSPAIPDENIDFIFTDPVYETVDDYEWLGREAMRVLKPKSAALVWCGGKLIDECKRALVLGGLRFRWTLYYACSAKAAKPVDGGIFPWVTSCWFLSKGDVRAEPHINDWYFSPYSVKAAFKWNKGGGVVEKRMGSFTRLGSIVYDPFAGHATVPIAARRLRCHFVAFEIDDEQARKRLASIPELLPFQPQPIQRKMDWAE